MSHLDKVKEHLGVVAEHHRKTRLSALLEAAVARSQQEAAQPPTDPQTGLQAPDEGFWTVGGED